MKNKLLTALITITAFIIQPKVVTATNNLSASQNSAPLAFIENKGQVTDQNRNTRTDIQFSVKAAPGLNIFIGTGAIRYQFSKANVTKSFSTPATHKAAPNLKGLSHDSLTFTMYRMDVELIGANQNAKVVTEEKQDYYENYFTDWSGEKGVTACSYTRIIYKDIYPYIDWVLYVKNGQLEHEFVIHDGGKASDIQLKYGGATNLKINTSDGSLTATTPQGAITEDAPKSYQPDGNPVKTGFKLTGEILTYETNYKGALVIDPTLQWATYYGGSGNTQGNAVATDDTGNVYMTGFTTSTADIATVGAYQTTDNNAYNDVFLVKFNDVGVRQWATYYGGGNAIASYENGIAIDGNGNVYITGQTMDASGIATTGTYQTSYAGQDATDAFIVKFNPIGTRLWGTYYGGVGLNVATGIALDNSGNAYITGFTDNQANILATPGAYQTTYGGGTFDGFIAKFDSVGTRLWGTFYGGPYADLAQAITTDNVGNIFITGQTYSSTGIATNGAFKDNLTGNSPNAFLAKFDNLGNMQWATYYGENYDQGTGVATDGNENVYFTGFTESASGITTTGAYQTTLNDGSGGFLAKFSSQGTRLWGTYYSSDDADAVATDGGGNVYITGQTGDTSGIATPGAYQTTLAGRFDAYLVKFDSTGSRLWATYYGGGNDWGFGIATNSADNVYITGYTTSTSGIATPGAFQTIYASNQDAFLAKFSFCTLPTVAAITGPASVCSLSNITLANTTTGGVWNSNNTGIATVNAAGVVTGAGAGIDTITYSITNTCGTSNAIFPIEVKPLPTATITAGSATTFCPGDSVILTASAGASYLWNNNATTQSINVKLPDSYSLTITDTNGCKATSNQISISTYPVVAVSITASGDTLTSFGAGAYQWYLNNQLITGDTGSVFIATQPGDYTVETTDSNGCRYTSTAVQVNTGIYDVNQIYGIKLYPNPSTGNFTIEFTDELQREIEITDANGRIVVTSTKIEKQMNFNLELAAGIYFLRVTQNGQVESLKFSVVQK